MAKNNGYGGDKGNLSDAQEGQSAVADNNVDGGGGDRKRRGSKKEMSVTSWRQLSPKERNDFFGGTRPGSQSKAKKEGRNPRDGNGGGRYS